MLKFPSPTFAALVKLEFCGISLTISLTLTSPRDCIVLASITVTGVGVVKVLVLVMWVPVMTICFELFAGVGEAYAADGAAGPSLKASALVVPRARARRRRFRYGHAAARMKPMSCRR